MQYIYTRSVFIKYMYNFTKPFLSFFNLSEVNGIDICDVTFTGVGGTLLWQYVTKGAKGVWKSYICDDIINRHPNDCRRKKRCSFIFMLQYLSTVGMERNLQEQRTSDACPDWHKLLEVWEKYTLRGTVTPESVAIG